MTIEETGRMELFFGSSALSLLFFFSPLVVLCVCIRVCISLSLHGGVHKGNQANRQAGKEKKEMCNTYCLKSLKPRFSFLFDLSTGAFPGLPS
jgi:hypothetical protein